MALCRPEPSSIYIEGKVYAPAGSNYYYIDFILLTSWSTSKLATTVNAAQEVSIPAAKMTCRPGVTLYIQHGWSWVFQNALICRKRGGNCLRMPFPPPWSWLVDDRNYLGSAERIRFIDQIGTPSQNICLGQPVYQMKGETFRFQNLVQSLKSLKRNCTSNLLKKH